MSNLLTMTEQQLREMLRTVDLSLERGVLERCIILAELDRRQLLRPDDARGPWVHWRAIAAGHLHPAAAWNLGGGCAAKVTARLIEAGDMDFQRRLFSGEKVPLARHDANGRTVTVQRTIKEMDHWERQLALAPGKLRPIAEQAKMLLRAQPTRPRTKAAVTVRADLKTREIVIGQIRFKPALLIEALSALGFQLLRKQTEARAA